VTCKLCGNKYGVRRSSAVVTCNACEERAREALEMYDALTRKNHPHYAANRPAAVRLGLG
jgi:hypothetical protein